MDSLLADDLSHYFFVHSSNIIICKGRNIVPFAGCQVPISSYFFLFFLFFLAILHLTCISYISFWGFLLNFSFFLSGTHQLFLKIFQSHFFQHYFIHIELYRIIQTSVFGLWWIRMAVGVLEDNIKIQKICNLHQIVNKYMNKVPIFS